MHGPIEDLLNSEEIENEGWVRVVGFRWVGTQLTCDLQVHEGLGDEILSSWQVLCDEVREYQMVDMSGGDLQVDDGGHPVVRQHTDTAVDLAFRGIPGDPIRLIGGLWKAHRETCDGWIPFDRYLNLQLPLEELLRADSGVLAQGPRFLLEAYASELRAHSLAASLSSERSAKYFADGKWLEQQQPLSVMQFGESFIVAERFRSLRLTHRES